VTLDDLTGQNYASTTEVAELWDGADPRTVRRMAERGEIPSIRVGVRYMIPVEWLRQQAGMAAPKPIATAAVDLDQLADRVAGRVVARILSSFASLVGGITPDMAAAGPAPPGPAATDTDPLPGKERSHAYPTRAQ
jgi:hypothetical protein